VDRLEHAAISRTLVDGTWLKMLRYQCTMQRCQAASGDAIPDLVGTSERGEESIASASSTQQMW
jgi:hypothetical protein